MDKTEYREFMAVALAANVNEVLKRVQRDFYFDQMVGGELRAVVDKLQEIGKEYKGKRRERELLEWQAMQNARNK